MSKISVNLQDTFLNQVRKESSEVRVILLDGSQFQGVVKGFDNFTIVMINRGEQRMIYKHAIAQMIIRRAPRRESGEPSANGGHAPKKQEAFNSIDLSSVKVEEAPTPTK